MARDVSCPTSGCLCPQYRVVSMLVEVVCELLDGIARIDAEIESLRDGLAGSIPLDQVMTVAEMERRLVAAAHRRNAGNQLRAAEELGISPRSLRTKERELGLVRRQRRGGNNGGIEANSSS